MHIHTNEILPSMYACIYYIANMDSKYYTFNDEFITLLSTLYLCIEYLTYIMYSTLYTYFVCVPKSIWKLNESRSEKAISHKIKSHNIVWFIFAKNAMFRCFAVHIQKKKNWLAFLIVMQKALLWFQEVD